jgi:rhodanese-related sulfurtransferase
MEQLFTFIGNHPLLVGAFVLFLILFIRNEMSRGGAAISSQKLVQLVNSENAIVIDVREANEYSEGHIVDAINIPFASFESRSDELNKHKDKPLIVACKMGQHSGSAGTILRKKGFTNVLRLTGGMAEWRGQNLPVVKT